MCAVDHKTKTRVLENDGLCARPPANPGETERKQKLGCDIIVPNVAAGGF